VVEASGEAIRLRDGDRVEPPAASIGQEAVQAGPPVFGPGDGLVGYSPTISRPRAWA
jgi:hypothetical protein